MSKADQEKQSSIEDLLAEWRRMQQVESEWAYDAEQRHDGCNAHAHRKAARIYRQCAEALAALRAAETGQDNERDAFAAGFSWAINGTDRHGEYVGDSVDAGFENWRIEQFNAPPTPPRAAETGREVLCDRRGPGWQCIRERGHHGRCETITVKEA